MKPHSAVRDFLIWTRQKDGGSKADYYAEVFDRWVSIYGPDIAVAPTVGQAVDFKCEGFDLLLRADTDGGLTDAATRVGRCIPNSATEKAFWGHVCRPMDGWMVSFYIFGRRYPIFDKAKLRRLCELYMLYALISIPSILDDAMQGVGTMMKDLEIG